ncbi:Aldose 1-epimerase precursor [uncultured Clostridium sp.]|uniref:aldose epimerase family protein n=1 Tax=uncultured Clostridium sp. TaxID=59620 RepID=UPI000823506E|nr:aldose epimerase family protein [uncultured Clostridium sp.]SCJ97140.1 Aldose 1-epimerase precursor [uncultured Clostridium sp.]
MEIIEKVLGILDNKEVICYSISNSKGIEVKILNYGGIITDIVMPDRNNKRENIVLKYKNWESYIDNPSYLGALIGRTGGRIYNGEVYLGDKKLVLSKNYNPNQGHGGNEGFNKKFYKVRYEILQNEAYIELSRISPDMEENYPGNLEVKVKYILTEDNELKINYYGKSDKDTLVNMTNHSYFNLSGNGKDDILNHDLYIKSKSIVELNENQASTGLLMFIEGTEYDFTTSKKIGKDINGNHPQLINGKGYDIPWYLEEGDGADLELYDECTGRALEVYTDRKSIVVYTHNYPDDEVLENNKSGQWRYGVAIEPQNPPIGVDSCFVEDSILKEGQDYISQTVYRFEVR